MPLLQSKLYSWHHLCMDHSQADHRLFFSPEMFLTRGSNPSRAAAFPANLQSFSFLLAKHTWSRYHQQEWRAGGDAPSAGKPDPAGPAALFSWTVLLWSACLWSRRPKDTERWRSVPSAACVGAQGLYQPREQCSRARPASQNIPVCKPPEPPSRSDSEECPCSPTETPASFTGTELKKSSRHPSKRGIM